ncbi:MAG: LysR family transcriptional regulator [Bacteroidales bacterium]|nr:LysR family transcriptional regulator [Bacteroidales bacterium]
MVDIGNLKIFAAVADCGGFSKAGEALGVSQSAVSQSIAQLEKHYGISLFDRSDRKHIRLTPKGEVLLAHAREMLSESDRLDFIFDHYDEIIEFESLKIAFDPSVVSTWASPLLSALFSINPMLQAFTCTQIGGVEADVYLGTDSIEFSESFRDHPLALWMKKFFEKN